MTRVFKHPLFYLIATFVGLGILYNVTTPIFETPDEVWHYAYIRQLALQRALPVVDAEGKAPYRHEGLQPPLYYAIGSIFIGGMSADDLPMPTPNPFARIGEPRGQSNDNRNAFLHTADEQFPFRGDALAVHLIRFYSLLLSVGTILLTYALAREIFPEQSIIALCAAALVAFLPQFIFISSAISNDNLATLITVATLWQLARVIQNGMNNRRAVILGILVGAGLLTKLTTIALAPFVLLAIVSASLRLSLRGAGSATERSPNRYTEIASSPNASRLLAMTKQAIIFALIVAALAGWWYIRNLTLYGDLTTFGQLAMLVGERARPLHFFRWVSAEGEGLRLSLWGMFGWFNILASPPFYFFFDALAAVGIVGIVVALFRRQYLSIRLAILPLWCTMIFVAFWGYASIIVTTQGRLLFPALPAWAILWSWGIAALIPPRWHVRAISGVGVIQLGIAALAPIVFIVPAYQPTIIAENVLPANVQRSDAHFENGITWLGATVDRTTLRPGEEINVTIYQRVPAGNFKHAAIFVHVVNSAGVIVAQRDSLPGNGNLGALINPATIADTYRITIPLTVPAPDDWRIVAGIYNTDTGERLNAGAEIQLATVRAEPSPADSWNYSFDGRATLTHADIMQRSVKPGGALSITLYWRDVTPGYSVFLHALGANDQMWASIDMPLDSTRPMQIDLPFDPTTPPGVYQIELGVYPTSGGDRVAVFDRNGQESGDRIFLGPVRVK